MLRWLAAVVLLTGCSGGVSSERADGGYVQGEFGITVVPPEEREAAPAIAGETVDGGEVALADFAGRPVVVNVWFSTCSPCREEADELVAAERELRDDDVAFLGVNIRDDASGAAAFQENFAIGWPSIYDPTSEQLLGFRDSLPSPGAVPTTWVIDSEGRVAARVIDKISSAETLVDLVDEVESGA
jgi:thiol-disulfide isomerase/thioredoxin